MTAHTARQWRYWNRILVEEGKGFDVGRSQKLEYIGDSYDLEVVVNKWIIKKLGLKRPQGVGPIEH